MIRSTSLPAALLVTLIVGFVWSGISPRDRFTWLLEVAPVIVVIPVLIATHRRFPLTPLAYTLIWLHAWILIIGGHYTYAEMPIFNWLRDALHWSRNHYDRLGHFAQGFVPAIVLREVLIRTSPLHRGKWLTFLTICVCLAVSAVYELMEWAVASATGNAADAFLGTQGDAWDTQKDMGLALAGAMAALVTLSGIHDRQLGVIRSARGQGTSR